LQELGILVGDGDSDDIRLPNSDFVNMIELLLEEGWYPEKRRPMIVVRDVTEPLGGQKEKLDQGSLLTGFFLVES
jgi:hypothetical protein